MKFEKKIDFGNLLTIIALLITVISFGYSWRQDIQIKRREQANDIRNAASTTLARIERWEEISLSFYREIQPVFVETSEQLEVNHNVVQSRDYLWRQLNHVRNETQRRILDEELQTAYVELYSYHPAVKPLFEDTLIQLAASEEKAFMTLLDESQNNVFAFTDSDLSTFESAELGNRLRNTAYETQTSFEEDIENDLTCLTDFLAEIILKSDEELLNERLVEESCH